MEEEEEEEMMSSKEAKNLVPAQKERAGARGVSWLSQRKVFQLLLTFIPLETNVLSEALPTTSVIESYNAACSHFKMRGKGGAPFPDIST